MPRNTFNPSTKAESAKVNENFLGAWSGEFDDDKNSLEIFRRESTSGFIVSGLGVTYAVAPNSRQATIGGGVAIINGKRIVTDTFIRTFTASTDTYIDLDDTGTFHYVEVANGATTGMTLTANSIRICKVTTNATNTNGRTYGWEIDPLGNMVKNNHPTPTEIHPALNYFSVTASAVIPTSETYIPGSAIILNITKPVFITGTFGGDLILPNNTQAFVKMNWSAPSDAWTPTNTGGGYQSFGLTASAYNNNTGGAMNVSVCRGFRAQFDLVGRYYLFMSYRATTGTTATLSYPWFVANAAIDIAGG